MIICNYGVVLVSMLNQYIRSIQMCYTGGDLVY